MNNWNCVKFTHKWWIIRSNTCEDENVVRHLFTAHSHSGLYRNVLIDSILIAQMRLFLILKNYFNFQVCHMHFSDSSCTNSIPQPPDTMHLEFWLATRIIMDERYTTTTMTLYTATLPFDWVKLRMWFWWIWQNFI